MKLGARVWVLAVLLIGSLGAASWRASGADLPTGGGFPLRLGDFDGDGKATVVDLVRLVDHLNGTAPLSSNLLLFADVNQDGVVDSRDVTSIANAILGLAPLPNLPDSDGDGLPDAWEILLGLDPHNPDTDGNGILDGDEDTDHDGLKNRWEALYGYDPRDPSTRKTPKPGGGYLLDSEEDPDFDGLTNLQEQAHGTHPFLADTDGDGWDDATEIRDGTDPLDPNSGPRILVTSASEVSFLNAVAETPPANTVWTASAQPASYLNALSEQPPTNTLWLVTAAPVSYLNSVLETPPSNTAWLVSSLPVSYLNSVPETPPSNTLWLVNSLPVSYLNSEFEQPPTNTLWAATSPVVSYLNAVQEPAPANVFFVSPSISYTNATP